MGLRTFEPARFATLPCRRRGSKGFALLSVLWGLTLLTMIAGSLAASGRSDVRIARNIVESAQARALAEAGIARAILLLLNVSSPQSVRLDGTPVAFAFNGGEVRISLQDEGGKIDLNQAPAEALAGAFRSAGLDHRRAATLTDAVADWRDSDSLRRPDGAEGADYRRAGLAWVPRNAPFTTVEELRRVIGVTPEIYARVEPLVTTHSHSATVNQATASPAVLAALSGTGAAPAGTGISARLVLPAAMLGAVSSSTFGTRVRTISVTAEARTNADAVHRLHAVLDFPGKRADPYRVLAWRSSAGRGAGG